MSLIPVPARNARRLAKHCLAIPVAVLALCACPLVAATGAAARHTALDPLIVESGLPFDDPAELVIVTPRGQQPVHLARAELHTRVTGAIARTRVVHVFRNPANVWAEAQYRFPLPDGAAVDHLSLFAGERVIVGEIRERAQARAEYAAARDTGRRAALVEQQRSNRFTLDVANLPPATDVRVEIEFQQPVEERDGVFSLRLPTTLTPRYDPAPGDAVARPSHAPAPDGPYARIDGAYGDASRDAFRPPPAEPASGALHVEVDLAPGFATDFIESPTHPLDTGPDADGAAIVRIGAGHRTDRDFVLRWRAADPAAAQGRLFVEPVAEMPATRSAPTTSPGTAPSEPGAGTVAWGALVVRAPPVDERPPPTRFRDVTFVLDRSGSMAGVSIREAKRALEAALDALEPDDTFNLVTFANDSDALFATSRPATPAHLDRARARIRSIEADGGTRMAPALLRALRDGRATRPDALRQVVFVTDGAVSNEAELFRLIADELGPTRLFTVGIGRAPNDLFMRRAARHGRGTFTFIASPDEVETTMRGLLDRIAYPVLTDVHLQLVAADGRAFEPAALPDPLPDLYAGDTIMVSLALPIRPVRAELRGRLGDHDWREVLDVSLRSEAGLGVLWARRRIEDVRERARLVPPDGPWTDPAGHARDSARREIVALGLAHHLVTEHTSLVAVDRTPVRPGHEPLDRAAVPNLLPAGTRFGGSATATDSWLRVVIGLFAALAAWGVMRVGASRPGGVPALCRQPPAPGEAGS